METQTLELIFAIIVGSASFVSGLITMIIFIKKNWLLSKSDDGKETSQHRITAKVSARLPSLIIIEIILLLWYLMGCTPLMLYFWCYLPLEAHMDNTDQVHNILASVLFVVSFVPIYTTHIIRLWLLKLKFNITSLSMLNQLGMIKWKDIRQTSWTKIYYSHKWTHNIQTLLKIAAVFTITTTIIYTILVSVNMDNRIYLNSVIFGTLTFILLIGIYSLKEFNDPFNIFREEVYPALYPSIHLLGRTAQKDLYIL